MIVASTVCNVCIIVLVILQFILIGKHPNCLYLYLSLNFRVYISCDTFLISPVHLIAILAVFTILAQFWHHCHHCLMPYQCSMDRGKYCQYKEIDRKDITHTKAERVSNNTFVRTFSQSINSLT